MGVAQWPEFRSLAWTLNNFTVESKLSVSKLAGDSMDESMDESVDESVDEASQVS